VEIAIGIRQKPVDRTDFRRSAQLSDEAAAIVAAAGRDEDKLRRALEKADEAIRLNPDNDAAITIKDRIQTSIGGKAAVVLSSADESRYQAAIQELQKNNIIEANAIVEQLLQNDVNRRSAKILDLQKRIKALL
jgi:RNase P/RNase MRP subunit p30